MKEKTLLILVDGMRPDAIPKCGNEFLPRLMQKSTYTMQASTVMPSVTLPCHTSLFFSVDPERHGITTNDWTPPVRPIVGLADLVEKHEKKQHFSTTGSSSAILPVPAAFIAVIMRAFRIIPIQTNGSPTRQLNISMNQARTLYFCILA